MIRLLSLLLLIPLVGFSQNDNQATIDSLKLALTKTKQDTSKINLLNKLAIEYIGTDAEISKSYASQSANLSKKINFKMGEANAYSVLAKNFHKEYKQSEAIKYYKQSLAIYTKLNDTKQIGNVFYRLANVYNDMNDYSAALDNYFHAVKVFEEIKDSNRLAIVYNQIATIYRGLDDFKKSKYYLDLSTKLLIEMNDTSSLTYNYINYAQLYERTNETDKVEENAKKAYEFAIKNNDKNSVAVSLFALGLVDKKRGIYNTAILKINQALVIFEELSNSMGIANVHNELGLCYFSMYEKDKNKHHLILAKQSFEASNKLYTEANLIDGLPDNYLHLSKINEIEKDYKSSLENFQLYAKYYDSILNISTKETIKNLEDKRTIELNKKEIQLNKITLENKEKQKWYYIGGILLLGIFGILLYYQSQNRRKTNEKLQLLNSELDTANKTKTRFFSILNHDLRAPVSNLIHFLHLQKENPELLDEENRNRLENKTISGAENLLTSMEDLLLWSKGQMESFMPQPKQLFVSKIFEDTQKHFSGEAIQIVFENPDDIMLNTDENYLKTIIRNLAGNAIKALAKTENAIITWKAGQENDQKYLSISDNGPGGTQEQFKALYDDKEVVGIKTGLGLHLIRDLAKAIDCKIDIKTQPGEGTTFILTLN